MKKLVLGIAILGGMAFAIAQDSGNFSTHREHCHKKEGKKLPSKAEKLERMKKDLGLTDAQIEKIQALHNKEEKARVVQREQNKAKKEARFEENRKEMKSILTPEQYKKWEEQMTKRKNKKMKREPRKSEETLK